MTETPLLSIEDLHVHFYTEQGVVKALNGVELHVGRGEAVGLVGETGCGKSLTARAVMRLLPSRAARVVQGRVTLEGTDLLSLREPEMRRLRGSKMAMIFQEPGSSLNPVMRVGDQIVEAVRQHHAGLSRGEWAARTIEVLGRVGMPDAPQVARSYPHMLSGGMQQRVMIAMGISCDPLLLIADEPTTALDVTIGAQVLEVIRQLKAGTGLAVLLITHDFGVVADICDKVAVMYAGTVVEFASTRTLLGHPLHPYTQGLFEALPQRSLRRSTLGVIPGTVPDLIDLPQGCLFRPRCRAANDRCAEERPRLRECGGRTGCLVACHVAAR